MAGEIGARFMLYGKTAAAWTSANPTPLARELCFETDTGKMKVGNGSTAWNSLAYFSGGLVSSFNTRTGAVTLTSGDVTGALTYTPVNKAGDTLTGKLNLLASAAGGAGLNIGIGVAPTTPVDGDIWTTIGTPQIRLNGGTFVFALTAATLTIPGAWTLTNVALTIGNSTAASAVSIAIGATTTGLAKTVNIGTGGVAGSTTTVTIGTVGGGTSNLLLHGALGFTQSAETSKSAAATVTGAEIRSGIVSYTGAAANLTMPTGTSLDTSFAQLVADTAIDFAVINTGSGAATLVVNTGVTSLGALAVAAGASGQFRLRKSGTATYLLYRLS